jgi:hypothetical protein
MGIAPIWRANWVNPAAIARSKRFSADRILPLY